MAVSRTGERQMMSWLYYLGHWGVRLFLFLFTRFEIRGKANVPRRGAVLVSANHLSLMDPPVVGVSLGRTIIFMAKEELFRSRFSGYFISRFGAFPVHRGRVDREALRQAERVLDQGRVLVMFPEGSRGQGQLREGFTGAALIATRCRVPVLPVGITGTEAIKGWGWMLRRPRITVNIGSPFELPAPGGKGRREELEAGTRTIMGRIADLLPPRYRGEPRGGRHAAD
jgi:1-acyl-sn-glycerol-3-phosphate acyltransferase